MASLIHAVQSPPFEKVGVIDLETFFPAKERFALAMKLNNLIASPGFAGWMEGESLDVGSLLYTRDGKPRLSILSIAHLADAERMFFVTILLNEVLAWIRTQPGTSSLRAVLYMDEIFGYFPPTAKPPSKMPMLTLLKQARAFGLGIVLATQNPVDLDYKGLSNTGTWFLGRLQTKRDKERVLEGLEGASNAAGQSFDRPKMDQILSSLGNRVFLMNNVHEDQPVVFQTRWALSYLRGPLTREQIQTLMAPRKQAQAVPSPAAPPAATASLATPLPRRNEHAGLHPTRLPGFIGGSRPVVPPDVPEFFIPRQGPLNAGAAILYRPRCWALPGSITPTRSPASTPGRHWGCSSRSGRRCRPISGMVPKVHADHVPQLDKSPEPGASFAPLPSPLSRAKSYAEYNKALKNYLYRERKLTIWFCPDLKAYSQPGESQRDFRLRLSQGSRELRDQAIEELRAKYAPKRTKLYEEVRKARERLDREQAQASKAKWDAAAAFGNSVLGAFLGRKTISKTNVSKATSAAKAAGKAMQQSGDTGTAQADLDRALEKFTNLEIQVKDEIEKLEATRRPEALVLEAIELPPKKADITIEQVVLAWTPWTAGAGGQPEAAY